MRTSSRKAFTALPVVLYCLFFHRAQGQRHQMGIAPDLAIAEAISDSTKENQKNSSGSSATNSSSGSAADSTSTPASPGDVASLPSRTEILKELTEMKARMAVLEKALEEKTATDEAADADANVHALRSAEAGAESSSELPTEPRMPLPALMQAVPAGAAAPTPPEITAETTTKSAPMPGDWTWLNSGGHNVDSPMSTKYFAPEIRFDTNYILDYNHPEDDSMGGSTEMFRSDEWQLEQVSVGGDFRIQNVRGRILTMDGLFATTTPRNDASYNRGQWNLSNAYRYFSEAWGGYHWDVSHGLNVDAGIFVSYIGLFSYYNFDNWAYQPSFVSSNTPWFFGSAQESVRSIVLAGFLGWGSNG
jgi:Putative beta-barrel porin-2, OmpL-like. bbp2